MKTLAIVSATATVALSACTTLQIAPSSVPTEVIYQTLNQVDFAQTVTGTRNPTRYEEVAWPTHEVIGHHPSAQGAEAFGAAWGLGHYLITGWLDREAEATGSSAWRVARWTWNLSTIFATAQNVARNHRIGLSLFGGHDVFPPLAPANSPPHQPPPFNNPIWSSNVLNSSMAPGLPNATAISSSGIRPFKSPN